MKPQIDRSKIKRVYSGKPGCACGCRGSYSESKASITKTLKRYEEAEEQAIKTIEASGDDGEILFWDSADGERTYTIYLRSEA